MPETTGCSCGGDVKLIFACSGAADVGQVADLAARRLGRSGAGKMFCITGVGGRVPGIIKSAQAAQKILAIDGCPLNCTRLALQQAGITDFQHLQLADMGLEKGKTPPSEDAVARVTAEGAKRLQ